jgi:hypothetical protein
MTTLEQIEQNFSSAHHLDFVATTNLQKEPSVILIKFIDPQNHIDSYNLLCKTFDHEQLTTVLSITNNKISLQIVDSDTADVISINNLSFDKEQLKKFQQATPSNWRYIVALGHINKEGTAVIVKTISLLTFVGYKVVSTS